MCTTWTSEEWLENSKPAKKDSVFTLIDTRYNQNGDVSRVYAASNGDHWGVLPGEGNYLAFYDGEAQHYGTTPNAAAILYLERNGYTLAESPSKELVF